MLSPRGSLSVDERTNTLLVQDTSEKLADIRRLVQTLDVPVRQVLIEARIVIVSDTFERIWARAWASRASPRPARGLIAVAATMSALTSMRGVQPFRRSGVPSVRQLSHL